MTTTPRILLCFDDEELKHQITSARIMSSFTSVEVASGCDWTDVLVESQPSVALIQACKLSPLDCEKLIKSGLMARIDVIFVTNGEPNSMVDLAMRHGASYHLRAPLDIGFFEDLLGDIYQEIKSGLKPARQMLSSDLDQFGMLVGSSVVMRKLYHVIRKASDSLANVFIVGESGTGKELVANTLHLMSPLCNEPFIAVNCGALSPELIESELFGHVKGAFTGAAKDRSGVFEQAQGGSLFLDEITEMPMEQQVKLLRVLEMGEYRPVGSDEIKKADVRIISATNRDPTEAIKEGLFREDLYFRLAHFPVHVPPLRDREEDITGLAKHFLAYRNREEKTAKQISDTALKKIAQYHWPGNVRELKHAVERAVILADTVVDESHFVLKVKEINGSKSNTTLPSGLPLEEIERGVILKTLRENDGNKSLTASLLGISVKTLYNKLEKYQEVKT